MFRKKIKSSLILILFFSCFFVVEPIAKETAAESFFELIGITSGFSSSYDVLNFVSQHLARIGIKLYAHDLDWGIFYDELFIHRNFDLFYIGITRGEGDPDVSDIYCENASLNIFGYDTTLDWDDEYGTGLNEWYIQHSKEIMPPD